MLVAVVLRYVSQQPGSEVAACSSSTLRTPTCDLGAFPSVSPQGLVDRVDYALTPLQKAQGLLVEVYWCQ
mgnify:CR=1 FL=1